MKKFLIANKMSSYILGQSDGISFKNISDEDIEILTNIAARYNKEFKLIELKDVEGTPVTSSTVSDTISDKRKIKKMFVTNGKETIKINPDLLQEYMAKGYRTGRK